MYTSHRCVENRLRRFGNATVSGHVRLGETGARRENERNERGEAPQADKRLTPRRHLNQG